MDNYQEIMKYKEARDNIVAKIEKQKGILEERKNQLESKFEVTTLEEGEKVAEALSTKIEKLESKLSKALSSFREEYDAYNS